MAQGFDTEYCKWIYNLQDAAGQFLTAKTGLAESSQEVEAIANRLVGAIEHFETAKAEYAMSVQTIGETHLQLHGVVEGSTPPPQLPGILQGITGDLPATMEAVGEAIRIAEAAIQRVICSQPLPQAKAFGTGVVVEDSQLNTGATSIDETSGVADANMEGAMEQKPARPRSSSMEPEVFDDILKRARTHYDDLNANLVRLCPPPAESVAPDPLPPKADSPTNSVPPSDATEHKNVDDELPDFDDEIKDEDMDDQNPPEEPTGDTPYVSTGIVNPPMSDSGESPKTDHGSGSQEWVTVEAAATSNELPDGLRTPTGSPTALVPPTPDKQDKQTIA